MSTTTSARLAPRTTARPCMIMSSSGTGTVVSKPCMTMPRLSPTSRKSHERVGDGRGVGVIGGERDDRLAALAGA